jgi:acyl-CoA thioester hydrolase
MSDFKFSTPIQVRYSDFDMLGHINNATFITYIEVARLYYFIELGWMLDDVSNVVAHLDIDFLAPILPGQQVNCRVKTSSLGSKSFQMQYEIYSAHSDDIIFAKAHSVQVCFEKKTGKTVAIPNHIHDLITKFEKE